MVAAGLSKLLSPNFSTLRPQTVRMSCPHLHIGPTAKCSVQTLLIIALKLERVDCMVDDPSPVAASLLFCLLMPEVLPSHLHSTMDSLAGLRVHNSRRMPGDEETEHQDAIPCR